MNAWSIYGTIELAKDLDIDNLIKPLCEQCCVLECFFHVACSSNLLPRKYFSFVGFPLSTLCPLTTHEILEFCKVCIFISLDIGIGTRWLLFGTCTNQMVDILMLEKDMKLFNCLPEHIGILPCGHNESHYMLNNQTPQRV